LKRVDKKEGKERVKKTKKLTTMRKGRNDQG
jgi:hypothetical protein